MPDPIEYNSGVIDLSRRFLETHALVQSPLAATETIIASLTINDNLAVTRSVFLRAFAAYTVGTNGVSGNLKIRQTDASGTTIVATGAVTQTAATLVHLSAQGNDASPVLPGQVYVVTLTIASGSATSTVSAVSLQAIVV